MTLLDLFFFFLLPEPLCFTNHQTIHCKVIMNNVDKFNNNCGRERPRIQMAKKYILSVTRNLLTQENRQNCVIRLCIMRCNQHSFYRCTLRLQSFDFCFCVVAFKKKNSSEQEITRPDHVWFVLRVALSRLWYCCVNVKTSTFLSKATCIHEVVHIDV